MTSHIPTPMPFDGRGFSAAVGPVVDHEGALSLACVARRTYEYSVRGRIRLADTPDAVIKSPVFSRDDSGLISALEDDSDVVAAKIATDVVVHGSAFAPTSSRQWQIKVGIGRSMRILEVCGERRTEIKNGQPIFSEPATTTMVPLSWELAYGGYDIHAQQQLSSPPPKSNFTGVAALKRRQGLFAYPRNRIGRAYFIDIDRARADGARLPQIEDPVDRLTPERFFVPRIPMWIDAPIPGALGWLPHAWYPRGFRLIGPFISHTPPMRPIRESTFPDGHDLGKIRVKGVCLPRSMQGAAPGLAVERLRGDEVVILGGLDAEATEVRFNLPGETPRYEVRLPGAQHVFRPKPVLQTIRVDTERRTISLTWSGAVRLIAPVTDEAIAAVSMRINWERMP